VALVLPEIGVRLFAGDLERADVGTAEVLNGQVFNLGWQFGLSVRPLLRANGGEEVAQCLAHLQRPAPGHVVLFVAEAGAFAQPSLKRLVTFAQGAGGIGDIE